MYHHYIKVHLNEGAGPFENIIILDFLIFTVCFHFLQCIQTSSKQCRSRKIKIKFYNKQADRPLNHL